MSMRTKYSKLFELMRYWQEYESSEKSDDLERFSIWLNKRCHKDKTSAAEQPPATIQAAQRSTTYIDSNGEMVRHVPEGFQSRDASAPPMLGTNAALYGKEHPTNAADTTQADAMASVHRMKNLTEAEMLSMHKYLPLDSQIATLLGRLHRFLLFYTKKVFVDTEIRSVTEFGIVGCIYAMGAPKKIEVINLNLIEKTTGTEIMKRLLKAGLIEEFDDNDDKRSKRVRTTPKGAAAYVEAVQKISRVSKIVGGNLPEEKKQDIVAALDYLNSFHNAIYAQQAEASIEEILDKNVFGTVTAR